MELRWWQKGIEKIEVVLAGVGRHQAFSGLFIRPA
jgi:hypothetical protein